MKKTIFYTLILFMLAGCKSCKYSLSGINIPPDVKNISVAFFNNQAQLVNPNLSQKFTELLKDKFIRETSLALVPENGDFKVSGSIVDYKTEIAATNSATGSARNRFVMRVKVVFESPKHKEMNFTEEFSNFQEFNATDNFQSLENALSEEVSRQIVQAIFNRIALKW